MNEPQTIKVIANGRSFSPPAKVSLPDFVDSLSLNMDRVVVERNGQALTPEEARRILLADGDRLEIVRIVAGG